MTLDSRRTGVQKCSSSRRRHEFVEVGVQRAVEQIAKGTGSRGWISWGPEPDNSFFSPLVVLPILGEDTDESSQNSWALTRTWIRCAYMHTCQDGCIQTERSENDLISSEMLSIYIESHVDLRSYRKMNLFHRRFSWKYARIFYLYKHSRSNELVIMANK